MHSSSDAQSGKNGISMKNDFYEARQCFWAGLVRTHDARILYCTILCAYRARIQLQGRDFAGEYGLEWTLYDIALYMHPFG